MFRSDSAALCYGPSRRSPAVVAAPPSLRLSRFVRLGFSWMEPKWEARYRSRNCRLPRPLQTPMALKVQAGQPMYPGFATY
jgi:hypothetical protein